MPAPLGLQCAPEELPKNAINDNHCKDLEQQNPVTIPQYDDAKIPSLENVSTGEEALNLQTRRTATKEPTLDLGKLTRVKAGPVMLHSLTDDMFVLEEPSFVLPYLYERRPPLHLPDVLRELRECNDIAAPIESIPKDVNCKMFPRDHLPTDHLTDGTGAPYFDSPLGIFFIGIGLNLVHEVVCRDLLQLELSSLSRHKRKRRQSADSVELTSLQKNIKTYELVNSVVKFNQKRCLLCGFQTESSLVLEHHMEHPHMQKGLLCCNFCTFSCRKVLQMLQHCQGTHGVVARLTCLPPPLACSFCSFSCSTQRRLAAHVVRCEQTFHSGGHLAPDADWVLPAKIPKSVVLVSGELKTNYKKARKQTDNSIPSPLRPISSTILPETPCQPALPLSRILPAAHSISELGVTHVSTPDLRPDVTEIPLYRPEKMMQTVLDLSSPTGLAKRKSSVHMDTPRPKQSQFVVCEVCNGYIRDLTQLKNHLQIAHKITVHDRLLNSRPPINCQKCDSRFYTWQGLELHLLGDHGLVSEGLQNAASQSQDGGHCPRCGKGLMHGLVEHMSRVHAMRLKLAHVLYKCPLCCHIFNEHPFYEAHVKSQHSGGNKQ